jgi:RimJ/RimL family protein N-acetyltransferase
VGIEGVSTPPYRIETDRLVIRCYDPRDAAALADAVNESLDHLTPWMPWAAPAEVDAEVQLLRSFRRQFDADENYVYGVFDRDETRVVGGSGFHPRGGPSSLEIGYWLRADSIGMGYATEVAGVLTRVGFEVCGVERMDIQIDPANVRSRRVPEKLGYEHEATLRRRLPQRGEGAPLRDSMVYTLVREELASSPCMSYAYRAYDAAGRALVSDTGSRQSNGV